MFETGGSGSVFLIPEFLTGWVRGISEGLGLLFKNDGSGSFFLTLGLTGEVGFLFNTASMSLLTSGADCFFTAVSVPFRCGSCHFFLIPPGLTGGPGSFFLEF